jgi:hypothetical protein
MAAGVRTALPPAPRSMSSKEMWWTAPTRRAGRRRSSRERLLLPAAGAPQSTATHAQAAMVGLRRLRTTRKEFQRTWKESTHSTFGRSAAQGAITRIIYKSRLMHFNTPFI